MILNIILMVLTIGWVLNASVFGALHGQHPRNKNYWLNVLLALASGIWLVVRLTP